jgi:hypothetical protein
LSLPFRFSDQNFVCTSHLSHNTKMKIGQTSMSLAMSTAHLNNTKPRNHFVVMSCTNIADCCFHISRVSRTNIDVTHKGEDVTGDWRKIHNKELHNSQLLFAKYY